MSEFKPGEIVDITIKGAHVVDIRKLHECQLGVVFDCDSGLFPLTIPLGPPGVTIERVAPAEWPPRTGDLWRDANGMLYLALQTDDDGEEDALPLSDISGDWLRVRELAKRPGLTLVHREDEQDEQPSPGEQIPGRPAYVVGQCGHPVARDDWQAGYRVCRNCPYPMQDEQDATP